MNERIRISPVRVILEDGTQLGVIPTDEARAKVRELGLDLLEVSPNARPPVCKIIDAGKWKYQQSRNKREAKRNSHTTELKQIKLRPKTDDHDIDFKARHARRFIEEGNKVQFMVRFRGRENAHPETGRKALYVSRSHTIRFTDMSEDESRPLIDFLQAHQTRPEFTCRVRWSPGTLTVWDNRCTQHCAVNDYHGQRRRMRRLTVGAQTPR